MGWEDIDDEAEGERELTEDEVEALLAKRELARFDPKPYKLTQSKKIIAVVDTETDPFAYGDIVAPFMLGFDDGQRYLEFRGDDCVKQFFEFLACETDEFLIYAHNGGKFDFHFFTEYLSGPQNPLIMGGRLVKVYFAGQEFRDSYSIIPEPLSAYAKDEIDYQKFRREVRHLHLEEISNYLRSDCRYLLELVRGFHDMYGDKLTVAGAALSMLNSMHGFERMKGEAVDARFRQYYFGGRNQCFETGILRPRSVPKFKMIDRRSMYPSEMRNTKHPISATFDLQTDIDDDTDFACIVAKNDGCLPTRAEDGGLDFTVGYGTFYATIHEIKAGLDTGTLRIDRVKHAWRFHRKATFADFIDRTDALRQGAKDASNLVEDLLYKRQMNAPYGKFALNPRKFKQWLFTVDEVPQPQRSAEHPEGWTLHTQSGGVFIWCRPSPRKNGFINVATAASITGASRANLHRNLSLAVRPIYCDTDSIICEDFRGEYGSKMGQWQLEAEGDELAIAGKKLYAFRNKDGSPIAIDKGKEKFFKKASKGAVLSVEEIFRVCNGEEIIWRSPVPNFALGQVPDFTERRINMTG